MGLKERSQIIRLVLGYLAERLTAEEQEQLDDWINRSERNRNYFRKWCDETYRNQLLRQLSVYDIGTDWQMVIRRRRLRKCWRRIVVAAGVVLLIGGLSLLYRDSRQYLFKPVAVAQEPVIQPGKRTACLITAFGESVQLDTLQQMELDNLKVCSQQGTVVLQSNGRADRTALPRYHCVDVPNGGEFSFKLPDGTEIFLNAGSRLRFPEYFIPGQERRVYLSGEAYFDVRRDTTSPFLVCLEHTTVKVLGTSFNITAYPDEGREETTLVSGEVVVEQISTGQRLSLTPGQQGCYDAEQGSLSKQEVEVGYYTSWKNGIFAFYKQPLEQVMNILERWYLFDIDYQDPALKSILYTGKIARHASIQEVLHTFELLDEIRFEMKGKEITVSRK